MLLRTDSASARRAGALALAAALVTAAGAPAQAARTDEGAWNPATTYALLVGVLAWQNGKLTEFPTGGRRDRALEAQLLADGVPRDHVLFLEDSEATGGAIRARLAEVADRAGPGSTLIFYYAGHGLQRGSERFFANYDVVKGDEKRTALGVSEIGRILHDHFRGDRLLLLGDCCHSGALGDLVASGSLGDARAAALSSASDAALSTSRWTFTNALIAALSGDARVDSDHDRRIRFGELDAFVHREMADAEDQDTHGVRGRGFDAGFVLKQGVAPRALRTLGPFTEGDYVDASWKDKWYRAQILAIDGGKAQIHYVKWDSKYDGWVSPSLLRPLPKIDYPVGARVEALWKGKWYPATVTAAEEHYFHRVHFDGFGSEWDEWAPPSRIRLPGGGN